MARERAKLWIVIMPNGTIVDQGLSRISADHALAKAIQTWLLPDIFGPIEWGSRWSYGALRALWPAMEQKGWKVHEIELFSLPTKDDSNDE
ncbi:MAG: hypothetical protein AAGB23_05415 [Pseudomonadota bacterium]